MENEGARFVSKDLIMVMSSCASRAMLVGSGFFLCFCWFFGLYAWFQCDLGRDSSANGSKDGRFVDTLVWIGHVSLTSGDLGRMDFL